MGKHKYIETPEKLWELPLKKNLEGNYIVIPKKRGYSNIDAINKNKTKRGYVYLIKCSGTDLYKIGVSTNPYNRIQSIDSSCPYELEILSLHELNDPYEVEGDLKEQYKQYNIKKEWFSFNVAIVGDIMITLHNTNVLQDGSTKGK